MRRLVLVLAAISLSLFLSAAIFAEETTQVQEQAQTQTQATEQVSTTGWKEEIKDDIQGLKGEAQQARENRREAMQEEAALKNQLREAVQTGDAQKARALRTQLKATHQENVQQRQQDLQGLRDARKEFKSDVLPPALKDRRDIQEDVRDRREDIRDRRENIRDRREDSRERHRERINRSNASGSGGMNSGAGRGIGNTGAGCAAKFWRRRRARSKGRYAA